MNPLGDRPVVARTIERLLADFPDARLQIAAPNFDRGGELEAVTQSFAGDGVSIFYGHDASPLDRILDACRTLDDREHIVRVDGLHFCVDTDAALRMLDLARSRSLDCVKLPDDFPVQFTSDIYRIGALRRLKKMLSTDDTLADPSRGSGRLGQARIFNVHPKYYMFMRRDQFACEYLEDAPSYPDALLSACRRDAASVYREPRLEVNDARIWSGDQLSFHYELAVDRLDQGAHVLDVACGDGYGARMLAGKAARVVGADLDAAIIEEARTRASNLSQVTFRVEDVTRMSFRDASFDAVTSMETVEHVDDHPYFEEVHRVLRPGGKLILSTPQNRCGHIPVNPVHLREYSLKEILARCERHFDVVEVLGIKAGRIIVPDQPLGTNTVMVGIRK